MASPEIKNKRKSRVPHELPFSKLRPCSFGESCYRRNPAHFMEYGHPHLENLLTGTSEEVRLPTGFKCKLDESIVLSQLQILSGIVQNCQLEGVPKKIANTRTYIPQSPQTIQNASAKQNDGDLLLGSHNSTKKFEQPNKNVSAIELDTKSSTDPLQKSSRQEMHRKIRDWTNISSVAPVSRNVLEKLNAAAPYNFFLTTVLDSLPTHEEHLSITFSDLLHPTLGVLKMSLQINFMVEFDWLQQQYDVHGYRNTPLLILYEDDGGDLKDPKKLPQNVKAVRVKPSHAFGHHHTKMSIYLYQNNSMRVVVSTANLIASDWENRTQGLWVSPECPPLPENSDPKLGDSLTEFRAELMRYLSAYHVPALQEWISRIRQTDFSKVRVCFVGSVPGTHKGPDLDRWGHRRLAHYLRKFGSVPDASWTLFYQCSSIGSLGTKPEDWMCGELRASMSLGLQTGHSISQQPAVRVIYPSFRNVANSIHGLLGGACLPYSIRTHQKQTWFTGYLNEWKSDCRYRSEAMPHIKTYGRISPDCSNLAWFHLSSANLSKAAWGMNRKGKGSGLYIMSYEAGVLFLPQLLIGKPVFNINIHSKGDSIPFPLPFDLPLAPYGPRDKPWVTEFMEKF